MCGIAGFVDFVQDARNPQTAQAMLRSLYRRGPDAGGKWESETAVLLHRRLIVIDPEGGAQPMVSPDGNTVLVYNGELYNTEDIRAKLREKGHTFKGHSDTEVLLHAFLEWGTDAFAMLNGIYAFAIWRTQERQLILCRDRLGVKPLFYAETKSGIVFGSTLEAVLCHDNVEPVIDADGLRTLMLLGPARPPQSGVFKQIKSLLPGHYAIVNEGGMHDTAYWSLKAQEHGETLEQTIAHTHELIWDATERQLVSDVPLATFLSGGLDSSILSLIAARHYQKQGETLHTWSVDYKDNAQYYVQNAFQPTGDNEYIQMMSEFLGTKHHTVMLDPYELAAALMPATDARNLPGMADVDSSLLLFCSEVKRDFTVCLSGECADELFGGYPWYHREEILFEETFPWSRATKLRQSIFATELIDHGEEFVRQHYLDTCRHADKLSTDSKRDARMREMFCLNLEWFMATLLDRKDRMSMYSGLEVRVPFCDHRIVEYAYNMPWDMKALEGREKGIVRRAFEQELPHDIVYRKKSPYPKTFHPEYTSLCASYVRRILSEEGNVVAGLLNEQALLALMEQPETLEEPWFGQLMRTPQIFAYIIQLDHWFKQYGVRLE